MEGYFTHKVWEQFPVENWGKIWEECAHLPQWGYSTAHAVLIKDAMLATNNWIFLEELPAVNVIVHTLAGWYDVFRKRKYAILGYSDNTFLKMKIVPEGNDRSDLMC